MHTSSNGLIKQLARSDQAMLLKHAQEVELQPGDVLAATHAKSSLIYFPTRGSIALYAVDQHKTSSTGLAISLIGAEGAAGLQAALGFGAGKFQLLVQSAGEAYAVKGPEAQRLIQRRQQVLIAFSRYLWSLYENIVDFTARAYTHTVKARLAHWLLLSKNRCGEEPLMLTHAHVSKMLGVRRSSISIAARELKLKRYINYSRGCVTLLNVTALEALSKHSLDYL